MYRKVIWRALEWMGEMLIKGDRNRYVSQAGTEIGSRDRDQKTRQKEIKKAGRDDRRHSRQIMPVILAGMLVLFGAYVRPLPCVYADEIVDDAEAVPEDIADALDTGAESAALPQSAADTAAGDLAGLFEDTGVETISEKGETLEEARETSDPMYGSGDGGSTVNTGHLYQINGVLVRNSDFPSAHYECWTYANNVYAKIWGHNFLNLFNDSENMLRNLPDEELTLTPEHLKAYVSAAPAGAVLRVCDAQYLHADDGWGHSQVIISHDENGFTVFEGGLAAWPHRREAYFTWTGFCYSGWPGKYHYIKYIKWPGAGAWSAGQTGENARDLGESRMEPYEDALEDALNDIFCLVAGLFTGETDEKALKRVTDALEQVSLDADGEKDSQYKQVFS